jgi:hypothetical protein
MPSAAQGFATLAPSTAPARRRLAGRRLSATPRTF